ncbi:MAG: PilN domain-containing protein [Actinobacteria bacterium]|nr:PilN domain-containing protein [Actinomycetota bacterium]
MKRIDLLPPEQRVKASRERGLLWAILILVAIVVALGMVYMWQKNQVGDQQADLDRLTAESAVVQQKALALAPYAAIQTTRTAMTQTAQGIYDSRVPWSTILQQISLVIPDNVRLQSLTGTVPATMLPGPAVPTTPGVAAAATADITFVGTTYTHRDVAEFMTRLGLIPQLSNIQLASSAGADATGTEGATTTPTVTFTVTASLRPYLTPPPATVIQGAAQ